MSTTALTGDVLNPRFARARRSPLPVSERGALDIPAFMDWAGIGRTKVFAEIKAGRLEASYVGRSVRITRESAEAWLAALPNKRDRKAAA